MLVYIFVHFQTIFLPLKVHVKHFYIYLLCKKFYVKASSQAHCKSISADRETAKLEGTIAGYGNSCSVLASQA